MKTVWDRIHHWLDANAPAGYGRLRPGASEGEIRAAEAEMGLELPGDVVASFRIHDGQDAEPGLVGGEGWWLASLRDALEANRRWTRHDPTATHFPLAWNGTSDYVFLDLRDPRPGRLYVRRHECPDPFPLAASFRHWLDAFADELDAGAFAYSELHDEVMPADEID